MICLCPECSVTVPKSYFVLASWISLNKNICRNYASFPFCTPHTSWDHQFSISDAKWRESWCTSCVCFFTSHSSRIFLFPYLSKPDDLRVVYQIFFSLDSISPFAVSFWVIYWFLHSYNEGPRGRHWNSKASSQKERWSQPYVTLSVLFLLTQQNKMYKGSIREGNCILEESKHIYIVTAEIQKRNGEKN